MNNIGKIIRFKRTVGVCVILLIVGIFFTAFSVISLQIQQSKTDYIETEATIAVIEPDYISSSEVSYVVYVDYSVGDTQYRTQLDQYDSSMRIGDKITIYYDPLNPAMIYSKSIITYFMLGAGVLFLAISVIGLIRFSIREKRRAEQDQEFELEKQNRERMGDFDTVAEKVYYFSTKVGSNSFGAILEDEERNVVYECNITKYSFLLPKEYTFINHVTGRTTVHKVGNTVSINSDNYLTATSYFKFDGEKIWDYLRNEGIRIESAPNASVLGMIYDVRYRAQSFAHVETVHAQVSAAPTKMRTLLGNLSVPSGFKVNAYTENLDLLFTTLFAFSNTSQLFHD